MDGMKQRSIRDGRVTYTRVDVPDLPHGRSGFFDREGCTIQASTEPLTSGVMKECFARLRDRRRDFINAIVGFGIEAGRMARAETVQEAA